MNILTKFDQINNNIIKKYLYICKKNNNADNIDNEDEDEDYNEFNRINNLITKIIKNKLNFSIYKKLNNQSDINTLLYLFNHISAGIFIKIKDNKLEAFIPFENKYFKNNWSNNIKLDLTNDNSIYTFRKNRSKYNKRYNKYINNIKFWHSNANIINNEEYDDNDGYIPHSLTDYYNIINETLINYKIDNVTIFINKRDSCVLHKELLEPYPALYPKNSNGMPPKLQKQYMNKHYTPILSPYSNENYADIPFIIPEDWKLATNINDYTISDNDRVYWNNKKETAIFRGSATGSVEFKNNQRLQITKLDYEWQITKPGLLDAGIVSWNARDKIDSNLTITYIKPSIMHDIDIFLKPRIPMNKQLSYKYIINIDGHSATNRFSYLLQSGCLILNVESYYVIGNQRWYDHLIKPYVHYIPIKYDLSDLEEKIIWCRNNDIKCIQIVKNANELYNEYFTKEGLMKYTSMLLNTIANKYC
jgi:hypothetical protein